jgi:hypothetical protein
MQKKHPLKVYPTIACCGLDCGLCPTYYTKGSSRCPGCCGPEFFKKHPSCSIIACCVKKNTFETCAECNKFPCEKLDNWDVYDSFICHRVSLTNLKSIKEIGLVDYIEKQKKRIDILKKMLNNFNEGRSKSFYCIATALLPIGDLENALNSALKQIKGDGISSNDLKTKSRILRNHLTQIANSKNIELKLHKK